MNSKDIYSSSSLERCFVDSLGFLLGLTEIHRRAWNVNLYEESALPVYTFLHSDKEEAKVEIT